MWFENMTYEEKFYRFLLRTGASSAAIADARDKARAAKKLKEGKQTVTTLCATGKSNLDDVTPMYLWSYGNYRYEIEVKKNSYFSECEVFETSYEDALKKFENMVDKVSLV